MYQTKLAMVIGGTLSPGPALPSAFEPRVRYSTAMHVVSLSCAQLTGIHGILVGVGEMSGSYIAGKLGDKYGRKGCVCWLVMRAGVSDAQTGVLHSGAGIARAHLPLCQLLQRLDDTQVMCARACMCCDGRAACRLRWWCRCCWAGWTASTTC